MVVQWLTGLFNMMWRVGRAPGDWKNAVIVPIHKKGSRMECTNYRGIRFDEYCRQIDREQIRSRNNQQLIAGCFDQNVLYAPDEGLRGRNVLQLQ